MHGLSTTQAILTLDFMPKGSVEDFIHKNKKVQPK